MTDFARVEALLAKDPQDQSAPPAKNPTDNTSDRALEKNPGSPNGKQNYGQSPSRDARPVSSHSHARSEYRRRSRSRSPRRDGRLSYDRDDYRRRDYRESSYRGDSYRGGGRKRSASVSRSRSPPRRRRPDDRDGRNYSDRRDSRDQPPRRRRQASESPAPPDNEEVDRRTVFVEQLAARVDERSLRRFAEAAGDVKSVKIVMDRLGKRSKGMGYVEYKDIVSAERATSELTGKKLAGIPVIISMSEAEKNRQAARASPSNTNRSGAPPHRLYVGNIHFTLGDPELRVAFEEFGELDFVQLQRDEGGRSKGFGFVQFKDPAHAKKALESLNGKELLNRKLRVGLGNDRNVQDAVSHDPAAANGSSSANGGSRSSRQTGLDRAGPREAEKIGAGASALDDNDVGGTVYTNEKRIELMRKLQGNAESSTTQSSGGTLAKNSVSMESEKPTRNLVVRNAFDRARENQQDPDGGWIQELQDDFKSECEKYGKVTLCKIADDDDWVYLRFDQIEGAEQAYKSLNGRLFDGRHLQANYVLERIWVHLFRGKAS